MDRRYRKTIIAGNWKMNGNAAELKEFFRELKPVCLNNKNNKNILLLPATLISTAVTMAKGTKVSIGGQTMHHEQYGAYTGEISGQMLTEVGAEYVIVGHSERRKLFSETDEQVAKKVVSALCNGLKPILCVGETLCQRNYGVTTEVVRRQLKIALSSVDAVQVKRVVIAYEPVWAIGTGKNATAEQAQEVCAEIRTCLRELYGAKVARATSILYGGSLNDKNARELFAQYDIDGGLIGGASLKAIDFGSIIKAANEL